MRAITMRQGMRIFVVRHGESEFNTTNRTTGQLDPDLTAKGVEQSMTLARVLRNIPLDRIYASTLGRAVNTAEPVAKQKGCVTQKCDALKEINLGVLQGRFRDARDPEAEKLWIARKQDKLNFCPPGGETYAELESRVAECLREILRDDNQQSILIVGHSNTNRAILGLLMDLPRERWIELNTNARNLYEIEQQDSPSLFTIPLTGSNAETWHVK